MSPLGASQVLLDLQRWYERHCDGEWEHDHGVTIQSLDNPGWLVKIDLAGTELAGRPLATVARHDGGDEWLECHARDGRFEGAGGPHMLLVILRIFVDWATAAGRD